MALPQLRTAPTTIQGGELVARMLAAEGVDTAFGIIDGTYLGLCAAFGPNGIRLITPRHETSAAHMAGAFARLTGKLGVCIASNGPGVANVLPGVAVENAEGNRVLLITSSRREGITYPERGGTYQYFSQVDVTRSMTKHSVFVPSADRLAELMRMALRHCFTGRPGVVHVDVPENVLNGTFPLDPTWLRAPSSYRVTEPIAPSPTIVREAARMLADAERPLLHAGSGVVHALAEEELATLSTLLEAPVSTSWGARAVIDERNERALPLIYIDALKAARNRADVVLTLGSRLGETDWWGKAPYWASPERQKMIQVDLDPETLGNNRPVDLAVIADVKVFMRALIDELRRLVSSPARMAKRRTFVTELRSACATRRRKLDKSLSDTALPMHPCHVAATCREVFEDDAILVIDGGNTAIWTNFFHEVRTPHTVVTTPKMGMLGAGVSQALGAKAAFPDRQVYCVIGDGAMGFHQQEVETAVRNDLPVIWLVLCDRQWGMVKVNQQFALKPLKTLALKAFANRSLSEDETINTDLSETQFDQLGRAMGAHGERVADPKGLPGAIRRAIATGKPAVIHIDVDRVKHLWAPELKTFKDMHAEPAG
jgi:acetolactate synthase I/II/III large subunit